MTEPTEQPTEQPAENSQLREENASAAADFVRLTPSQLSVVDAVFSAPNDSGLPKWIVVSGGPGTGKTFLIHKLRSAFRERDISHMILAPTNVVARQIHGETIHKGLGGGHKLTELMISLEGDPEMMEHFYCSDPLKKLKETGFAEKLNDRITIRELAFKCKETARVVSALCDESSNKSLVIMIDEISMVSVPLFYYVLRCFGERLNDVTLIMFGDRNQIAPISNVKMSLFSLFSEMAGGETCSLTELNLTENVRHSKNKHFQKFINDWHNNDRDGREIRRLEFGGDERDFMELAHPKIVICGKNDTVKAYQNLVLNSTAVHEKLILIRPKTELVTHGQIPDSSLLVQNNAKGRALRKRLLDVVKLKPDVPVMINKTIHEAGLYSGEIFRFVEYNEERDVVELRSTKEEGSSGAGGGVVLLNRHATYVAEDDDEKTLFYRAIRTFPIDLFYAVTVHKVQGLTLNYPTLIHFEDMWEPQQRYVAASRVTSSKLLYFSSPIFRHVASLESVLSREAREPNDHRESSGGGVQKRCSNCGTGAHILYLVAARPRTRATDESQRLSYACNSCINVICS